MAEISLVTVGFIGILTFPNSGLHANVATPYNYGSLKNESNNYQRKKIRFGAAQKPHHQITDSI